jgi:release factor glutamine methyltransferase
MIWRETLEKTISFLESKGVPDATVASELLVARLLKVSRGFLSGCLDKETHPQHLEAMRRAMKRLACAEPLQYVLGEWDFRSLTLKCDRRALIPRPETEELVTRVLKYLHSRSFSSSPFIVDVGTGTGAIALSLAKEYPLGVYLATDISEDAIELAKENAKACNLESKVKFAIADGLDDFSDPQIFDVIVSNPPYIETDVIATLDARVKDFEPHLALDGGPSGLEFYDRYLADAINLLKPGGAVFFEIGENQGEAVRSLMFNCGFDDIEIDKDYSGHDRYAYGILS